MNILNMSISAGVLILYIVTLRLLTIHKLKKSVFVILWEIVLIRLLLPIAIPMKYSISNLIAMFIVKKEIIYSGQSIINPPIFKVASNSEVVSYAVNNEHDGLLVLYIIWLVGAFLFLAIISVIYIKEYMKMQDALPVNDESFFKNYLQRYPMKRNIMIMESDRISTPITYGILKPRIILPKMLDKTNTKQLEFVMLHECIHIRRLDNMIKMVSMVALCFHWFNPLVWVMYLLLSRDLELSCDERVIAILGESEKQAYALALIGLAEQKTEVNVFFNGFGKNAIKERINSVMKYKGITIMGIGLSIILILASVNVFATTETRNNAVSKNLNNTAYSSDNSYEEAKQVNTLLTEDVVELLKTYEPYGLTYDTQEDEMYYNGKVIRELYDEKTGAFIARTLGASFLENSVDVYCNYKNGKLTGLRMATEEEYKERTKERIATSKNKTIEADEASEMAATVADSEQFSDYQKMGLSYYNEIGKLIYKKQIVGYFMDEPREGVYHRFTDTTGTIGIRAVRDENDNLTGFEEVDLNIIFNANTVAEQNNDQESAEANSKSYAVETGGSDEDTLLNYTRFGVAYNKKLNCWIYKEKKVAVLFDSGYTYMNEKVSSAEDVYLQVIRDSNGEIKSIKTLSKEQMEKLLDNTNTN